VRFLLGGYTADSDGTASGIGMLWAGAAEDASAGGSLSFTGTVAAADSPSWLARHPRLDVVYAALEAQGAVQAFRRTGEETFTALGDPVPAGEATCHVAVAPDGGSLIASCWGDGRVVQMALDAAGRPSAPVAAPAATDPYAPDADGGAARLVPELVEGSAPHVGSGPVEVLDLAAASRALRAAAGEEYAHLVPSYEEDPRGALVTDAGPGRPGGDDVARPSRAHEALFLPGGAVATTDMGLDLVRIWRQGPEGLVAVQHLAMPRGCGPRHMVHHPSGHLYVVAELSCEVFVLAPDPPAAGAWRIVGGAQLGGTLPDDTAAEIALSRDAEFVYTGVRGSNTVATLRVRGAGEAVSSVALVDAGVDWPRHHIVVRDALLVAGQRSDEVASLSLDLRTGVPGRVRRRTDAPSPTCLLPLG